MSRSSFRLLTLGAALAVAAGLTYQLQPRPAPTAVPCDLNRATCRAQLDSGEISLRLSPQPLPVLKPITVEVDLTGVQAESVRFELVGAEMDMGLIQATLKAEAGDRFVGTTSIPVCASDRMRWVANVHVAQGSQVTVRSFAFDVPSLP